MVKRWERSSSRMPRPLSSRRNKSSALPSSDLHRTVSFTYPFAVNLKALVRRLSKTCLILAWSPSRKTGMNGSMSVKKSSPFSEALRLAMLATSDIREENS